MEYGRRDQKGKRVTEESEHTLQPNVWRAYLCGCVLTSLSVSFPSIFPSDLFFSLFYSHCPLLANQRPYSIPCPFLSFFSLVHIVRGQMSSCSVPLYNGYPLHFSSSDGQMEQQHWRSWSGLSKHPSGATVLYNFRHHTLNLSVYSYLVQYYYFILCGSCDFFMETLLVLFLFSWHWFPWKLDSTAFDAPLLLIYM